MLGKGLQGSNRLNGDSQGVRPQFNETVWKAAAAEAKSEEMQEDEARIMLFLDRTLAEHGAKSAAYIRCVDALRYQPPVVILKR